MRSISGMPAKTRHPSKVAEGRRSVSQVRDSRSTGWAALHDVKRGARQSEDVIGVAVREEHGVHARELVHERR